MTNTIPRVLIWFASCTHTNISIYSPQDGEWPNKIVSCVVSKQNCLQVKVEQWRPSEEPNIVARRSVTSVTRGHFSEMSNSAMPPLGHKKTRYCPWSAEHICTVLTWTLLYAVRSHDLSAPNIHSSSLTSTELHRTLTKKFYWQPIAQAQNIKINDFNLGNCSWKSSSQIENVGWFLFAGDTSERATTNCRSGWEQRLNTRITLVLRMAVPLYRSFSMFGRGHAMHENACSKKAICMELNVDVCDLLSVK